MSITIICKQCGSEITNTKYSITSFCGDVTADVCCETCSKTIDELQSENKDLKQEIESLKQELAERV